MTLYDKIMAIYPELQQPDFITTIRLQNDSDGRGDYIAEWNHPTLSKPTEEQLATLKGGE
jgi:hypothetical protein